MTSISTVGHAEAGAVPKAKSRNLSLDRARTFGLATRFDF